MKKFRTLNTKNKKKYIYNADEIVDLFECDSSRDHIIKKEEYDEYIKNIAEYVGDDVDVQKEEVEEFKEYWDGCGRYILSGDEYLTALIEDETWTSPTGVKPVYKVLEVIND